MDAIPQANTAPEQLRQFVLELQARPTKVQVVLLPHGQSIEVQPHDVGTGISQLLPVVVLALDSQKSLLAIEQPELHLHPALQTELGDLFVESACNRGNTLLVETHSEHLILRLLRRIRETAEGELPEGAPPLHPDQLSVIYVEQTEQGVQLSQLRVDETGEFIDRWPKGFFEERVDEILLDGVGQAVIFEYALEPELVATWHDRQSAYRFKESFGVGRGRVVSRYPSDWIRRVWSAFDSSDQNAEKRLEALLTVLTQPMTSRGSAYNGLVPWLENAEMEHARSPFHAILTLQNPRRVSGVLLGDRLDEASEPLWTVSTTATVPRHASALAAAVAPLLKISKHILLIDQHFNPSESRYRNSLEALLGVLNDHRISSVLGLRVEVHATADGDNKPTAAYFQSQCRQLVRVIPAGLHVRFVRWHQRPGGETLHHRYILTELGGVSLLHGLDEGPPGETNEINIQSKSAYDLRWAQYAGDRPAFDLTDEITITGTT